MQTLRLYADTSVFGGCFDEEFAEDSGKLFEAVRRGRFTLLLSTTTALELRLAPKKVRDLVAGLPHECFQMIRVDDEVAALRDSYLEAGVVGPSSRLDAEHIACASVARADLIVSWNFKHIVHFAKIRGYHGVNLMRGYACIPIHSPTEVLPP